MGHHFLWKLIITQQINKLSAAYGNQSFITVFTTGRQFCLIQTTSNRSRSSKPASLTFRHHASYI